MSEPLQPQTTHRLDIPADLQCMCDARELFMAYLGGFGLSEEALHAWKLVFSESVTNGILHGAKSQPEMRIGIEWWIQDKEVFLAVTDPGKGPPEEKVDNPRLPEDPLAEHGRGLPLIYQMTSRWEHWRSAQGYRVVIGRALDDLPPAPPMSPEVERLLEELSTSYESLSAFYRLGANLLASGNAASFISQSVEDLTRALGFSSVFLVPGPGLPTSLKETLSTLDCVHFSADDGFIFLQENCSNGPFTWENPAEIATSPVLRLLGSGACVPINALERTLGWLVAGETLPGRTPATAVLSNLGTFADIFGITLANAWLQEQRDRELQTRREMELAAEIQRQLLPIIQPPASEYASILIKQVSAREVAGDYAEAAHDIEGNTVLAMIDVMGKGVPAALLAAIFRTAFHLHLKAPSVVPLHHMLASINQTLCEQLGDMTLFVTCCLVRMDARSRNLEIANAGHCPAIFHDGAGKCREFEPSGPPLGLFADTPYDTECVGLTGGESLLLVTDGCYEWQLEDGSQFGWENLCALASAHQSAPEYFWQKLITDAGQGGAGYADDITLLLWRNLRPTASA
ncbi:MAG: SpoIIE family protein phosphatase [Verrucomicrobiota bacterium]|nr:SpoIIE family protein phosphatase [Verrucomicrobiota bacterium]